MIHVVHCPREGQQAPGVVRAAGRPRSNFALAFLFLSPRRAAGLRAIYEFCRTVDDIVDERDPDRGGTLHARRQLAEWSEEIARVYTPSAVPRTELGRRLLRTRRAFDCPREAFDEIIGGVAMDLDHSGYETMEQLRRYCYRVASCVGLLCIALCGQRGEDARRYAEHLGLALQYTNILRDVAEDAARGRVYLPRELLVRHGLGPSDILAARYDACFIAMAEEFSTAAEAEYQRAWGALRRAAAPALLPTEIMGRTYHRLLAEIRSRGFDVSSGRVTLRRRDKLAVAATAVHHTAWRRLARALTGGLATER